MLNACARPVRSHHYCGTSRKCYIITGAHGPPNEARVPPQERLLKRFCGGSVSPVSSVYASELVLNNNNVEVLF